MEFIIHFIGFLLLWLATDFGRQPESKVEFLSKNWWVILILLVVGSFLTGYNLTPQ